MQTNQTMTVTIGHNVFSIDHKTMMGNLNQFWDCGNAYRIEKGLPAKHLEHWVRSPEVAEYVAVLERNKGAALYATNQKTNVDRDKIDCNRHPKDGTGVVESVTKTSSLFITKRGKGGGTWAHLFILIEAAAYLDPSFRVEVYKAFIEGQHSWDINHNDFRYKPFNMAIDQLPDRVGKDNKWLYVHAANLLAERIGLPAVSEMPVDDKGKPMNRWNAATAHQLSARADAEKMLTGMVQFGLVRDWEHLKDLAERV